MRLNARTIRLRLTLIYGIGFLITGGVLLTIGYVLVRHNLHVRHRLADQARHFATQLFRGVRPPSGLAPGGGAANGAFSAAIKAGFREAEATALHRLLTEYIAALVAMTGISVAVGWLMAGRALAPLREITATARRVSGENLGERIALVGPSDELKELADTFDGMLSRLDSAFASQRHFVANASHELRTPLAIMRTEVDVALGDPNASVAELREMGEAIRETLDRSESLISALLTLARSESISGREERVDVAALAGDCITDLHARAEAGGVRVETDLQSAVVRGDSALLERLLVNLIDNGIRHNRPGGLLAVRTRTLGEQVQISVRNDGAVIDPLDAARLTEPFRRLTRAPGGFGLGLSIVRSVAEAHGGSVTLTPRPEGGLEADVRLPAHPLNSKTVNPRKTSVLTGS